MCRKLLLDHVPVPAAQVFPISSSATTPAEAADEYAQTLACVFAQPVDGPPPALDLILLGMGDDGHCASLFPGMPTLHVTDHWVVSSPPGTLPPPVDRITFTFPVLNAARQVVFLVNGEKKAAPVRDIFEGGATIDQHPSAGVHPMNGTLNWLLDEAAASGLKNKWTPHGLERAWRDIAIRAGIADGQAETLFHDLCRRYSEPGSAYHTLDHIKAMLDIVTDLGYMVRDDVAVRLAVWFHDAVYGQSARRQRGTERRLCV